MIFYVYKIILTEGRFADHYYIGQRSYKGKNIEEDRYKGSGKILKSYYKKYPNGYRKEILEVVSNKVELNEREKFYAGDLWETDPMCVNLTPGGKFVTDLSSFNGINKGRKHTEEEKQHLREIMTGRKRGKYNMTEEGRRKHREPRSEETRKNMRKKHKPLSEETRMKMSKSHMGKCSCSFSEEWREKQRISQTGKKHAKNSEETKLKKSLALQGKKKTLEHKKKLSELKSFPVIVFYGDSAYICKNSLEASIFANCSTPTVNSCIRVNRVTKNGFSFQRF